MPKQFTGGSDLDKKKEEIKKNCADLCEAMIQDLELTEEEDKVVRKRSAIRKRLSLAKEALRNQ